MLVKTLPIKLEGVAGVVSENLIPTEKYCAELATPKKLKRIIKETGFESLSIADDDVCTSDMCFQAAENLFNNGGFDKKEIGALVFISQFSDYRMPATAYVIQHRLGLENNLIAFDINLGCSGFVYGLYVAASLLSNLNDKKILLCCGDVSIRPLGNIGSASIFGDAGACAVIGKENNSEKNFSLFNIHSYGDRWDKLVSRRGYTRYYKDIFSGRTDKQEEFEKPLIEMDGMAIMDFTFNEVVDNIEEILSSANLQKNEIGAYLLHQPQKLLVNDMAEKMNLNPETVIQNAQHFGNLSSASIPLLLTEIGADWNKRENKKVLMAGYGVGLSVASTIMDLDNLICLETKKYERSDI